jgi:hypothetical protein
LQQIKHMNLLKSFFLSMLVLTVSLSVWVGTAWSAPIASAASVSAQWVSAPWVIAQANTTDSQPEDVRSPEPEQTEPVAPNTNAQTATPSPKQSPTPTPANSKGTVQPKGPYDMDAIQRFDDALYGS